MWPLWLITRSMGDIQADADIKFFCLIMNISTNRLVSLEDTVFFHKLCKFFSFCTVLSSHVIWHIFFNYQLLRLQSFVSLLSSVLPSPVNNKYFPNFMNAKMWTAPNLEFANSCILLSDICIHYFVITLVQQGMKEVFVVIPVNQCQNSIICCLLTNVVTHTSI